MPGSAAKRDRVGRSSPEPRAGSGWSGDAACGAEMGEDAAPVFSPGDGRPHPGWGLEGARGDEWAPLCASRRRMTAAWALQGGCRGGSATSSAPAPAGGVSRPAPTSEVASSDTNRVDILRLWRNPVWHVVKPVKARSLGTSPKVLSSPAQLGGSWYWACSASQGIFRVPDPSFCFTRP